MKKKKALALLLTAAMTVGMLAGCGGSDSAATAGNAETADTAGGSTSGGSTSAAGEEAPDDGEYYVDEDGNGQNVVADSAFILEWTELSDLNIENDEGKTDLELVFSEEPDSVTAERWPAEDRGQNFGNGYPEGESVSVEHAESWSIPGAEAGYIYEVDAVFENGTVSYGFEVKK